MEQQDKFYSLTVAGVQRNLPICPVSDTLDIAAFVMFSDVELTVACARELLKKSPDFDVMITAESKGIPLTYEMARQSGKQYFLARKSIKAYMRQPICVEVQSITTAGSQKLYLDQEYAEQMKGKRVLIVDDFMANGEAVRGLCDLVDQAGAELVGIGIAVEKGFQGGGDRLRSQGFPYHALAVIEQADENGIVFREDQ